jgi:hypothetical protein
VQESQIISVGGSEDLLVSLALERELMASFAHEDGVPGAPVLFGAHKDQLLSALFTCKDDLLGITLHVYLLRPFQNVMFIVWQAVWLRKVQLYTFVERAQDERGSTLIC